MPDGPGVSVKVCKSLNVSIDALICCQNHQGWLVAVASAVASVVAVASLVAEAVGVAVAVLVAVAAPVAVAVGAMVLVAVGEAA